MIGSTVGSYRILEKIRDGGAGTVFKAQGPKGEIVAIKMISEAWNEQRDRRKAFKREADITQKLVHPSVIRVFGYSEGPPRPYIVLEYFPSENLKFTLWHKQQVLEGRRMPILKQCAEALYYVHTQGVVHRDVKPENFLVNAEGSVRLIDFSIAQTKWDRLLFSFGKKVDGTPLYMAPEQIRNESVDQRADMYAFGVMVFELMTRRPPFIGASVDSILEKHLKSAPPSMRSIAQDVSLELDELVMRMLAKKAADRPADMSFVIASLSRLAKKEEEARLKESKGPSRVVASVGQAGSQVPGTRAVGTRPTPSAMAAVPGGTKLTPGPVPVLGGAAPTRPPSSTALPPAKSAGAPAAPPTGQRVTKTQTRARTPGDISPATPAPGQPETRTQTKVRPAPLTPPADVPQAPPATAPPASQEPPPLSTETAPAAPPPVEPPPVPPQPATTEPPPPRVEAAAPAPVEAAPTGASPAAGPAPAAKEASEASPAPAAADETPKTEAVPEPPKGNP